MRRNIINGINDKLKSTMQQQERDTDLIESLSKDWPCLLEENKKLEEVGKLQNSNLAAAPEHYGVCAPELSEKAEKSGMERVDERRLDSATETSITSVQKRIHILSEEKQRLMLLEWKLKLKEENKTCLRACLQFLQDILKK